MSEAKSIHRPDHPNCRAFERYLEAFNAGDLAAFDDLVTPGYVNHSPALPDPEPGPAGLKAVVAHLRREAPALRFELLRCIADGDLLAAHLRVHGFGPEPVEQMQIERFEHGRIAEHWRVTG